VPAATNGAPAGIFGLRRAHDAIFAGTSTADNNAMHALDPATGALLASFGPPLNPGIGPILGMAAVDYSTSPQRIYFATRRGTAPETLWCVELGPPGPLAFTLRWKIAASDISGSVVLRNGRVYVGNDLGQVLSVRASDGGDVVTVTLGDGAVRGFVFPDRASPDVYVSTDNTVFRLTDNASPTDHQVGVAVNNPSAPLRCGLAPRTSTSAEETAGFTRSTRSRYTQDARASTTTRSRLVVGAPSLDIGFRLVHVGSSERTFYAVSVPLP
jgi:outer membrane protein assembly factor BamB